LTFEELETIEGGSFLYFIGYEIGQAWSDIKAGFNDGWRDGHN